MTPGQGRIADPLKTVLMTRTRAQYLKMLRGNDPVRLLRRQGRKPTETLLCMYNSTSCVR